MIPSAVPRGKVFRALCYSRDREKDQVPGRGSHFIDASVFSGNERVLVLALSRLVSIRPDKAYLGRLGMAEESGARRK